MALSKIMGGFSYHQFRAYLPVESGDFPFFECAIDTIYHDSDSHGPHRLQRLANRGQGGGIEGRGRHIIETDYGTVFGHADACFAQSSNGSERCHVVKSH